MNIVLKDDMYNVLEKNQKSLSCLSEPTFVYPLCSLDFLSILNT